MKKPSRYFVWYEDQALFRKAVAAVLKENPGMTNPEEVTEPTDYWREKDFDNVEKARAHAKEIGSDVFERYGMTEDPLAPGMWDWEERLV